MPLGSDPSPHYLNGTGSRREIRTNQAASLGEQEPGDLAFVLLVNRGMLTAHQPHVCAGYLRGSRRMHLGPSPWGVCP